jgi:hypothetical protein
VIAASREEKTPEGEPRSGARYVSGDRSKRIISLPTTPFDKAKPTGLEERFHEAAACYASPPATRMSNRRSIAQ